MICFFFIVVDHFVTIKFFVRSPHNQITFLSFKILSVTGFSGQKWPSWTAYRNRQYEAVRRILIISFKTSLWVVRLNKSSSSPPHPQYSLLKPFILLNCSSLYAVTKKISIQILNKHHNVLLNRIYLFRPSLLYIDKWFKIFKNR